MNILIRSNTLHPLAVTCIALLLAVLGSVPATAQQLVKLELTGLECFSPQWTTRGFIKEVATCRIDDWISIGIDADNLAAWENDDDNNALDKLLLSLNGEILTGNTARLSSKSDKVNFRLSRLLSDTDNIRAWKTILGRTNVSAASDFEIAVALAGTTRRFVVKDVSINNLEIALPARVFSLGLAYVVFLIGFLVAAAKTNILRDTDPAGSTGRQMFSLGRTQMAFWFFLVLGGYMFVWVVLGDYNVLPTSMLGLTGISAVTALTAAVVPEAKEARTDGKTVSDLKAERTTLADQVAAAPGAPETPDRKARIAAIDEEIRLLTEKLAAAEKNREKITGLGRFFLDMISSNGKASLPRLQMVVWTIVLGLVFIHGTWTTLSMPEFSPTLLALMGLSSGTYVGFKVKT